MGSVFALFVSLFFLSVLLLRPISLKKISEHLIGHWQSSGLRFQVCIRIRSMRLPFSISFSMSCFENFCWCYKVWIWSGFLFGEHLCTIFGFGLLWVFMQLGSARWFCFVLFFIFRVLGVNFIDRLIWFCFFIMFDVFAVFFFSIFNLGFTVIWFFSGLGILA